MAYFNAKTILANKASIVKDELIDYLIINQILIDDIGYVQGDAIRTMNANATNARGVNNAMALASSMNESSVALVTFNQKNLTFEVKLMQKILLSTINNFSF